MGHGDTDSVSPENLQGKLLDVDIRKVRVTRIRRILSKTLWYLGCDACRLGAQRYRQT